MSKRNGSNRVEAVLPEHRSNATARTSIIVCTAAGTRCNVRSMPTPIHPDVRIGHVHLKVSDLECALSLFMCGVLGFQLTLRYGRQAAFISAGGYHHHIGLNTWESLRRLTTSTGQHRIVPSGYPLPDACGVGRCFAAFAACRHWARMVLRITGSARPSICVIPTRTVWSFIGIDRLLNGPMGMNGTLQMYTRPLDLEGLLAEASR